MYAITPARSPPHKDLIDDTPIVKFSQIIETVPVEQWQKRCSALETLVSGIPPADDDEEEQVSKTTMSTTTSWYTSPKLIRHLALPIADLLRDPRSSVVKRTCDATATLFQRCRVNARHLFKDLMPTILGVHAQTVHIIRTYVQNMVTESLLHVPCKAVMPLWLERLRQDKSRTVREASALYLTLALQHWRSNDSDNNDVDNNNTYLTFEIWCQVGAAFVRSLRDPYPSVRTQAKRALHVIRMARPYVWDKLLQDPDGPAAKDPKLRKWLLRMQQQDNEDDEDSCRVEELSVGSRRSLASTSHRSGQMVRMSQQQQRSSSVPTNVVVGGGGGGSGTNRSNLSRRSQLGPPVRTQAPFGGETTPSRRNRIYTASPTKRNGSNSRPPRWDDDAAASPISRADQVVFPSHDHTLPEQYEEGPLFVASFQDLKKKAKERRRRSSILQERWRSSSGMSSSSLLVVDRGDGTAPSTTTETPSSAVPVDDTPLEAATTTTTTTAPTPAAPPSKDETTTTTTTTAAAPIHSTAPPDAEEEEEHLQIAQQLLEAHRAHVDGIMETLRLEMDALKDFETLLLDEDQPRRPTEEDVLDYFESVGLCLDQRTSQGKLLQRSMDKISQGGGQP